TTASQLVYLFNATGQLTSIQDRNAHQLSLTYPNGNSMVISDGAGRSFNVGITNTRAVSVSETVAGAVGPPRTVYYGYDSNNRLNVITDTQGFATRYTYETGANSLLTQRYDQNNQLVMQNSYDKQGRLTS